MNGMSATPRAHSQQLNKVRSSIEDRPGTRDKSKVQSGPLIDGYLHCGHGSANSLLRLKACLLLIVRLASVSQGLACFGLVVSMGNGCLDRLAPTIMNARFTDCTY
jgi:hypothetical protein